MQKELEHILASSMLCKGMTQEAIRELLADDECNIRNFKKGEYVFLQGECADKMFLLVKGKVNIAKTSGSGKKSTLTSIQTPGDLFGEVYLFIGKREFEMEAEAAVDTSVLEISDKIFASDKSNSEAEVMLMKNLLALFARKAYTLNGRLRMLGSGSLREKIASYLLEHADEQQIVTNTMSREELADYMSVARPSLSREIGNMVEEGLIRLNGKCIVLCNRDALEELL